MRFIVTLILLSHSINAQSQFFRTYRVHTNAYTLVSPDKQQISNIYVDKSSLNGDLSNLPFIRNLRLRLHDLGYSVTKDFKAASYILKLDTKMMGPIITTVETAEWITTPERTVEIEGEGGRKKEITIEGESELLPVFTQSEHWRKEIKLKLYNVNTNELIWQGESWIDDSEPNQKHTRLLTYNVLRNFLRNSERYPAVQIYSRRDLKRIDELFYVPKY